MPFKSTAQRGFFNSPAGRKAGLTKKQIDEWNSSSRGMTDLPKHVAKKKAKKEKVGKADRSGIHRWRG